jgi:predicted transposase YdaD
MPGPIDDTLKHLTELSPQDWVVRGGWTAAPARLMDADIATITGATDKVIRVDGSPDWLLAVDFQAGHDTVAKLSDLLLYNSALYKRHRLRVRSLVVLLHKRADSPQLTGFYERGFPDEPFDVALRYRIVRVWQVPAEQWLSGGLGLVPLAPLGDVREGKLPTVVAQMKQRFDREVALSEAAELWSATYILMGLRYERVLVQSLLRGVITMKESVTYQAIIEEGEANEARKILLLLGRDQLGEPSPDVLAALGSLAEVKRLEELTVRLKRVASWQELLDLPVPRRHSPRRKPSS